MNKTKQQIAIAEACGWIDIKPCDVRRADGTVSHIGYWGTPPSPTSSQPWLPDYLNDLNAMREAEKVLDPDDYAQYEQNLRKTYPVFMGGGFHLLHATAAQRAEAFLRTIGKWEDE